MNEKRFKIYQDSIRKFESNRIYGVKSDTVCLEPYMTFKEAEKCCDLLNEQQATIERLQNDIIRKDEVIRILKEWLKKR